MTKSKEKQGPVRCKSLQFIGSGSIFHDSALISKRLVAGTANTPVLSIELFSSKKEVLLTMKNGVTYLLDLAGLCLEIEPVPVEKQAKHEDLSDALD